MPVLMLKRKSEILAEYRIDKKNVISIGGSKGNDIVIADKGISEHHCSISKKTGRYESKDGKGLSTTIVYEIKDNNTLTGTRLNDRTVSSANLEYGDGISIGSHSLVFLKSRQISQKLRDKNETAPIEKIQTHYLLGVYGKFEGRKYEIKFGDTFIGRENVNPRGVTNDVVLSGDMTVSKGHAKITCDENQCTVTDIGSTGGVSINGIRVGQMNTINIKNNDEIAVGRSIFRFVDEGNPNYNLPERQNIFLLKIRKPIKWIVTLAMLFVSFVAFYGGIDGILIINDKPRRVDIDINRYWSPKENVVKPLTAEYGISSSPAIADLNCDGINDIVFFSSVGLLYAWDGKKGAQLWNPVEIYNSGKSSPVIFDMNCDGIPDIIVVSDTSMLYIVDGQSGGIIRKEILGGMISDMTPAVCDLNSDGKPDVVICAEEGMVHFLYSPGFEDKLEKYTEFIEAPVYASPVIITTEKISPMVAVCSNNSKVFIFDGKTRNKKTVDLTEKTGKVHLIASSPAIGDLNGDGIPEIVVQSNLPQYISVIDITHFNVNWTYFVEPTPPAGIKYNSSPVIADINNDGLGDVVVFSANGIVYGLRGKTGYPAGEMLWKLEIGKGNRIVSSPALYDFDRNGLSDMAIGTEDGNVYIIKNSPVRKEMEFMAMVKASNVPITSSVAIGDINSDNLLEIVFSNINNTVQVLNTNIKTFKNKIIWPMFLGNTLHSGEAAAKDNIKSYLIMTFSGAGICMMLLVIILSIRSKTLSKRPKVVYL